MASKHPVTKCDDSLKLNWFPFSSVTFTQSINVQYITSRPTPLVLSSTALTYSFLRVRRDSDSIRPSNPIVMRRSIGRMSGPVRMQSGGAVVVQPITMMNAIAHTIANTVVNTGVTNTNTTSTDTVANAITMMRPTNTLVSSNLGSLGLLGMTVLLVPIANLVESGSDGVKDPIKTCQHPIIIPHHKKEMQEKNLRANNSKHKSPPRQITRIIPVIIRLPRPEPRGARVPIIIAVLRPSHPTIRARQHGNGNEGTDEGKISKHPEPAQPARAAAFQDQGHDGRDEGVEHRGAEDALDGAVGPVDAPPGLDRVDKAVHLVQALGEEAQGHDGRDQLEEARQAEEPAVGGRVLDPLGHEPREEAGLVFLVVAGAIVCGVVVVVGSARARGGSCRVVAGHRWRW